MSSCEKDAFAPEPYVAPCDTCGVDTVFYSTDIQPFFDASCVGCHPSSWAPDLTPGLSYDALINGGYIDTANAISSKLYVKIAPGGSMESYSTTANTKMTLEWINQGALNN